MPYLARRERLIIVPQNLYEFWAVATRKRGPVPGQNGLGMSLRPSEPMAQLLSAAIHPSLSICAELVEHWATPLAKSFGIRGFKSHDARLAAAMQTYGIQSLLTFNANDFKDFPITIIDPVLFNDRRHNALQ